MKLEPDKSYKTRNGYKATVHEVRAANAVGSEVSFPVKGTVRHPDKPRTRATYMIWTLDGKAQAVATNSRWDIVGTWE